MQAGHTSSHARKNVVVIGNGMVGQRFCEKLVQYDTARQYRIVTFCEEPRAAYDRVGLSAFFAHGESNSLPASASLIAPDHRWGKSPEFGSNDCRKRLHDLGKPRRRSSHQLDSQTWSRRFRNTPEDLSWSPPQEVYRRVFQSLQHA